MEWRTIEQAENGLADIAAELTALGDMIPVLLQNHEDMEIHTPQGIKILITGIRNRIESIRKSLDGNFRGMKAGQGG
jgi:flagellar basal body-associated protein FliL